MASRTVKNKNLRSPVTVVEERPRLESLGKAGARLKLDLMLLAHHGQPPREWQKLTPEEMNILRVIASEEDPAWGVTHQADAIGALAEARDSSGLLLLAETARNARADLRLQIAATYALGEIGGGEARKVLRGLLDAKRPEVRAQAATGLMKTGGATDLISLERLAERDQTFAGDAAREAVSALRRRLVLDK
jgi:HEAT repeats